MHYLIKFDNKYVRNISAIDFENLYLGHKQDFTYFHYRNYYITSITGSSYMHNTYFAYTNIHLQYNPFLERLLKDYEIPFWA